MPGPMPYRQRHHSKRPLFNLLLLINVIQSNELREVQLSDKDYTVMDGLHFAKQKVPVEVQRNMFHGIKSVILIDDQLATGGKLVIFCKSTDSPQATSIKKVFF